MIDSFPLNIVGAEAINYFISPKLTKILFEYFTTGSVQSSILIRNIDYDNYYSYDVNFIDKIRFTS